MITHCPICRYSLDGLPERHRCPECGFEYDKDSDLFKSPTAGWVALAILNLAVAVGFAVFGFVMGKPLAFVPPILFTIAAVGHFVRLKNARGKSVLVSADNVVQIRRARIAGKHLLDRVDRASWSWVDGSINLHCGDSQIGTVYAVSSRTIARAIQRRIDRRKPETSDD